MTAVAAPAHAETDRSSLRLLTAYRIISRFYFHLPVLFVLFYKRDLSLPVIETLLAVYGATVALSGPAGPRLIRALGARRTIALGEACKAAGLLLMAVPTVATAAAGQVLGGFGFSISAGPDAGLLAGLVPDPARRGRLGAVMQSWMFMSVMVAGVIGAVLFSRIHTAVLYCSAAAALLALVLVLAVREPAPAAPAGPRPATAPAAAPAGTGWWSAYYIAGRVAALAPYVGLLPFLFFVRLEVDLAAIGAVLGLFTFAGFLSARYAGRIGERFGPDVVAPVGLAGTAVSLALFGLFPDRLPVALVAITLLGVFSGGVRPMAMAGLGRAGLAPGLQAARTGRLEQISGLVSTPVLVLAGFLLPGRFSALILAVAVVVLAFALTLLATRRAVGAAAPAP
ncbi:MFS transporter [Streptomyces sp. NPDC051133]|uniref:MFS transporter n=1 Tax=Streptomyces sp. NPDC051133 TaxID=3155521 RepID=UPI0034425E65